MSNIVVASCAPGFWSPICFLAPTISDTVGFDVAPKGGPGGIRAADLQALSPDCLVAHPLESKIQNPEAKIQNAPNPKSKIQTFLAGFWGFWILDRYVAILLVRPPTPQILDFGRGFRILDFGFRILDFGFRILDFGFWILGFGFWILDFGFRISDFGFWILGHYVADLFVQILDLDFGFWILDCGFRILDFGFWILVQILDST